VGLGFQRLPVVLPPSTLDLYRGLYHYVNGKYDVTVNRVQDKLHWQSGNRGGELQPITETEFAVMDSQNNYGGKWTFRKDRNGAVEAFTEVVSSSVSIEYRKVK
jgi:hypothetical protein